MSFVLNVGFCLVLTSSKDIVPDRRIALEND